MWGEVKRIEEHFSTSAKGGRRWIRIGIRNIYSNCYPYDEDTGKGNKPQIYGSLWNLRGGSFCTFRLDNTAVFF